jgi:hypothetical protein
VSRHADLMDASGYWREVVTNFYFDKPGDEVEGTVLELLPKGRSGPPGLKLQTKEGDVWIVTAHQARLQFELKKAQPAKGDLVRITFTGQADKAAPGMSPAKEFTVKVRRQDSRPPESAKSASGEVQNTPIPGVGK